MLKEIEIKIPLDHINDKDYQKKITAKQLRINPQEISALRLIRRSIDARGKRPVFRLKLLAYVNENFVATDERNIYKPVSSPKRVVIIGGGPAGMFAALRLIELNIIPIILERGKDVRARRRDIKAIMRDHIVNPDSNYCFGEGGAGTYSDGKLYTRSTKRGNIKKILDILHQHGAADDILIDSHPHIGSNKLPKIVEAIRNTILSNNGEYHFESRVTDLLIEQEKIKGVVCNDNIEIISDAVILAAGHSARDIYYLLAKKGVDIEAKSFAMGVRIEHPQQIIDKIQYKMFQRHKNLPASSYNLNCQIDDKGVYSFCMCPGGIVVPASTAPGELVLNGMSVSRRDSPYANSGLVVTINSPDWEAFNKFGVFAGLEYQKFIEGKAFESGGGTQKAPAQRITDFIEGRQSSTLPKTSYIPGIKSAPLHEILPADMVSSLRQAVNIFGKKMRGYITEEAQILAAESRTSSPIRVPRDRETLMHIKIKGLFPSGEGAGYAGGIISAAIDGERCANAAAGHLNNI